jgi:hypothetical protein
VQDDDNDARERKRCSLGAAELLIDVMVLKKRADALVLDALAAEQRPGINECTA